MFMCLSKPHKVLKFDGKQALLQFQDEKRIAHSRLRLKPGDYVVCQGMFVVQKIPKQKAEEMLKEWERINMWV